MTLPAAVLASGGGTNLQALLDHERASSEPAYRIVLVFSDREEAGALERARKAGVEARVVPPRDHDKGDSPGAMLEALEEAGAELVFLAGYLRLVPASVVDAWRGRILNVHPALLPSFGGEGMYGRHVHRAVLASGARISGVTVHLVDERYDEGAILAQWPVPVRVGDTAESLARRVLAVEHVLYPQAAEHLARCVEEGRQPRGLDLPGEAFGIEAGGEGDLRTQIRRALDLPRRST